MNRNQGYHDGGNRYDNRDDRKNSHMYIRTLSLDFPPPLNEKKWLVCNERRTAFPFVITLGIVYHDNVGMTN